MNQAKPNDNLVKGAEIAEKPIFEFSLSANYVGLPLGAGVFLFLAVYGIYVLNELGAGVLTLVFAGLFLYQFYRLWGQDVRKAMFYDEFVRVKGKMMTSDIQYSKIENVLVIKRFSLFEPRTQVLVKILGEERPLTVLGNPKNSRLKLDLATWLAEKIAIRCGPT